MSVLQDLASHFIQGGHVDELALQGAVVGRLHSVGSSQYSRLCGKARAYRWGNNIAFYGYNLVQQSIDSSYVDGLSLTHGTPGSWQHIWTFASGLYTVGSYSSNYDTAHQCPCDNGNTYPSPPFVGNDYFCESVETPSNWYVPSPYRFFPNVILRFVKVEAAAVSSTILRGSPKT